MADGSMIAGGRVDVAKSSAFEPMLTTAELAARDDFHLGNAIISPSTRTICGPAGKAVLEPRVMQVLVVLAEAAGRVVTRDALFGRCWGGVYVGDDSLNRAIANIRRIVAEVAPGQFEIETIPRTGYRLIGSTIDGVRVGNSVGAVSRPTQFKARTSRRMLLGGGLAVAAAAGTGAWFSKDRADPRVAELIDQGRQVLRDELPDSTPQGIRLLKEAVRMEPANAEAWGLLALAWRNAVEHGPPDQTAAAVAACQAAARNALALDPAEGNAHAALAKLRPIFGDWSAAEQRLRAVLRIAPRNVVAISALGTLLQSVGRVRESERFSSLAANLDPLSPIYQFRRTFGQWSIGRLDEADRTIDRALRLWPKHPAIWNTRVLLFALTDRPHAALAMIDDREGHPNGMPETALSHWRSSLKAVVTRAPADIETAMTNTITLLARSPAAAVNGICLATRLGDLNAAFSMADAYLLRRGPSVGVLRNGPDQLPLTDQRWQMTMMLFIPSTAPMRADARFLPLCRDMGMVDYWRASGTRPDFLAANS